MHVVEFVSALPHGKHQARRLENFKMLRDALPGQSKFVLHHQSRAKLEEGLTIPIS